MKWIFKEINALVSLNDHRDHCRSFTACVLLLLSSPRSEGSSRWTAAARPRVCIDSLNLEHIPRCCTANWPSRISALIKYLLRSLIRGVNCGARSEKGSITILCRARDHGRLSQPTFILRSGLATALLFRLITQNHLKDVRSWWEIDNVASESSVVLSSLK